MRNKILFIACIFSFSTAIAQKPLPISDRLKTDLALLLQLRMIEYKAINNPVLNVDSFFILQDSNGQIFGNSRLAYKKIPTGEYKAIIPKNILDTKDEFIFPLIEVKRYPTDTSTSDLYLIKHIGKNFCTLFTKDTFEMDLYDEYFQYDSLYLVYYGRERYTFKPISGNIITAYDLMNVPRRQWPSQELSMRLAYIGIPYTDLFENFKTPTTVNYRKQISEEKRNNNISNKSIFELDSDTTFWIIPYKFKELDTFLVRTNSSKNNGFTFNHEHLWIRWLDVFFFTNDFKYTHDTSRNNIYEYSLHYEWYGKNKYSEDSSAMFKAFPQEYSETQPRLRLIGNKRQYLECIRNEIGYPKFRGFNSKYFIGDKSIFALPPQKPVRPESEDERPVPKANKQ